ncbi:myo-inositol-1(or 4)-monophosphatase [Micromonospora pallida]|uniref:Myo-inositol-1(Or 4)-monophosphatase n=1 Tax=Micromonospora pallida TaxID=145854 RepID=A0A1C6SP44_9ACTN|nr:inositol monophosphatase family protein [Micromonospora pallida]SCL31366.1 myo-inositol-1(or 4)-monophosphatase [Micromonospora pallida]
MSISDLHLVIAAAEAGATVVRSHYGSALTRIEKSAGDFATASDVEAEQAILEVLRAARPDDLMVGEESGRTGTGENGRAWLVDPLCGTLNYAVQTRLVSVNVALRVGSRVVVAASADPFAEEVFWTDGAGANVRCAGVDERLAPSAESRLVDVNLDAPSPYERTRLAARLLADVGFMERFHPRVVSTTLAVAWVAAGRRAAYVTYGDLRDSVHFAAGIALCQAAGCVVTGIDGQPLHTGVGGLVVAADEQTHAALLTLLRDQRQEEK